MDGGNNFNLLDCCLLSYLCHFHKSVKSLASGALSYFAEVKIIILSNISRGRTNWYIFDLNLSNDFRQSHSGPRKEIQWTRTEQPNRNQHEFYYSHLCFSFCDMMHCHCFEKCIWSYMFSSSKLFCSCISFVISSSTFC